MLRYYDEEDEIITIKEVKDNFKSFLVEGASFTDIEEYPILKDWMVPDVPPKKILPFNKIHEINDLSDWTICFYCRDEDFIKIRNNPKKYISLFKKCNGIIGLDYSIHSDFPIIKQKEQLNSNLSYSFFYGMRNIGVYPNIRLGADVLDEEFFKSIPKNKLVAIGTYGFIKSKIEKELWKKEVEKIILNLSPKGIIIYGSITDEMAEIMSLYGVEYYLYESWVSMKFRSKKQDGSK